jgi:hypothetical protein
MKDVIGDTAQELADYLDDLRNTEGGVTKYNEDTDEEHPVTEVGDAEVDMGLATVFRPSVSFVATVGGKRLRVTVSGA